MSLIRINNASFTYDKEYIFHNISFEIKKGDIFCLFGPNGCGKSTLLQCLLGIINLCEGRILLEDTDVRSMKPQEVARKAAYIPQVHEKPFPFKVIDIVLMGRASYTGFFAMPAKVDRTIAEESLEKVNMLSFKERPYTQLSGGETQLVLVARALAQQTPILIMDEPTSHLDFRHELSFLETIGRLVKDTMITVVMATHFPNHAFYFENRGISSKIALMNDSKIIVQGDPSSVLTAGNMAQTFNIYSKVLSYQWEKVNIRQIVPLKTL